MGILKRSNNNDSQKFSSYVSDDQRRLYNKWRFKLLSFIILGYGSYYLCRQNFSMIMPIYMEEYGYSNSDLGIVLSLASIIYGIGKFANGYLSDKSNARYFMPLGLLLSAITTFCLGFSESLSGLMVLWVINNWFQSMGWPPVARILTHWFSLKELGVKWSLGAASHQIGGAITLIFSGYLIANYGWRYAFYVPAIIAMIMSVILYFNLRESPQSVGLPSIEFYKDGDINHNIDDNLATIEIIKKVFYNRDMWLIAFANLCVYIVRIGIIFWMPTYLKEFKGFTLTEAGWQVAAYEIFGLCGGFAAGYLSDRVFSGQRGPVGMIYMLLLAINLAFFWYVPNGYNLLSGLLITFIGFLVYGPQILVGVASADFTSKKAIGTANGFVGSMGYVGSSLSGISVGLLIDNIGWSGAFIFFIIAALLGAYFFYLTWKK